MYRPNEQNINTLTLKEYYAQYKLVSPRARHEYLEEPHPGQRQGVVRRAAPKITTLHFVNPVTEPERYAFGMLVEKYPFRRFRDLKPNAE